MPKLPKMCTKCGLKPKQDVPYARLCVDCVVSCDEHQVQKYNCNRCRMAKQDSVRHTPRFKEIQGRSYRRRKYGLTDGQLDELLAIKECQGCGATEKLRIDHCHISGKVRGILCDDCNLSLGKLKDNVQTLKNLIDYLEES